MADPIKDQSAGGKARVKPTAGPVGADGPGKLEEPAKADGPARADDPAKTDGPARADGLARTDGLTRADGPAQVDGAAGANGESNRDGADRISLSRRGRAARYVIVLIRQLVHQWARDRCPQQASSLAFQTVLSVVPLLAVALAALRLWGNEAESVFVDFLSREFLPVSREIISEQLTEWSKKINMSSLGIVGLITTVLLAFVMVNNLEKAINAIWRAEKRRSLAQKFVVFYATATLAPLLLGASLYEAARFGLTKGGAGLLVSLITSFGALFLANMFLPAVRVRVSSAAVGAAVSTLLFEVAKHAFNAYVTNLAFSKFSGIYGALAVLPLWLVWIYYSWLVFLLGVELAYAAQNLSFLQRRDRRSPMSLENEIVQRVNGVVAARVMMAISSAYRSGKKTVSRHTLEETFDLSGEVLGRIAARLKEHDLIIEVDGEQSGYLPARPPGEISLSDVLDAFRSDDVVRLATAANTRLDRVLAEIDHDTRQRTRDLAFDQLD